MTLIDGALRDPLHRPGRAGIQRHGADAQSLGPDGCPTIIGHWKLVIGHSAYALHATDHNILVPANTLVHNPRYLVESIA